MATHSSILAWGIHWMRSLVGYSPWGHTESQTTEVTCHTHTQPRVWVKEAGNTGQRKEEGFDEQTMCPPHFKPLVPQTDLA